MDANNGNNINTAFNNKSEINNIPGQNIIDLTNQFYLEMSKSLLSENEYKLLKKILIEKCSPEVLEIDGVKYESLKKIYKDVFYKVKSVLTIIREIDSLREKLHSNKSFVSASGSSTDMKSKKVGFQDRLIMDSDFIFSGRLRYLFKNLHIVTFKDLISVDILEYPKYRGFNNNSLKELIEFIEFENIEYEFDDFYEFKEKFNFS